MQQATANYRHKKAFNNHNLLNLKDRNIFSLSFGNCQAVAVLAAGALTDELDTAAVSNPAVLIKPRFSYKKGNEILKSVSLEAVIGIFIGQSVIKNLIILKIAEDKKD